jgi:glycosyltransferase involved in cell wall biosynthesis
VVFYTPWIGSILSSRQPLPPGGAETQMLMLSKALARRGFAVAIVAFGIPAELPSEVDGVTIIPRTPYSKRRMVGKFIELFRLWRSLSKAGAPAIVHRGLGVEVGLLAVYALLTRRRLILSSANIADFEPGLLLHKRRDIFIYEYGARRADKIVVQTEEQVELCRHKFGCEPHLIRSIASLAPPHAARPEAFLWVGRVVSYKCPLEYLALARAVPEARFWMVAVPPTGKVLEADRLLTDRVMSEAQSIPNLELLSPRPHGEIEALMERAVASVNTADFEGMPNVLLEAWARGVPALVLRHDPDGVIRTHGLGEFANGSLQRLAELAREQWATRHDQVELAQRCRRYIAAHHAPGIVVDQWVHVLFPDASVSGHAAALAEEDTRCAA